MLRFIFPVSMSIQRRTNVPCFTEAPRLQGICRLLVGEGGWGYNHFFGFCTLAVEQKTEVENRNKRAAFFQLFLIDIEAKARAGGENMIHQRSKRKIINP